MLSVESGKAYIGETGRALGKRVEEHKKDIGQSKENQENKEKSALGEHMNKHGHSFGWDSITILKREDHQLKRKIKEGIAIAQRHPELNRDQGLEPHAIYKHILSRVRPRARDSSIQGAER